MLWLGCALHEYMPIVYAIVMHVNVYRLLCMNCYGDGYAC